MNNREHNEDDYRSLLLLDEISRDDKITQRDLSKNLGIALGLINSYIKNLASKGYITISAIPKNRYKYFITPTGFTEKTRLTYTHLRNFTNLYRVARHDFSLLFHNIKQGDMKRVVFCGVDEVAEIAYLSLKEAELELTAICDDTKEGKKFFGYTVLGIRDVSKLEPDLVVLTSFHKGEEFKRALMEAGVSEKIISDVSGGSWIRKIEG